LRFDYRKIAAQGGARQTKIRMIDPFSRFLDQTVMAAQALLEFGAHLVNPTVRLGVTGMSGAGKTVFITALVHGLVHGGRFPVFEAMATGRISDARLSPQPDDAVPRFDYENHVRALVADRDWPESTRRISELRLEIEYQTERGALRTLTLDIVDYPGEWLLDLPLLNMSYEQWSAESLALSRQQPRAALAAQWHDCLRGLDPLGPANEQTALTATALFSAYLKSCRDQQYAMSMLPPGHFLMPGDLAGSPALTFVPLEISHAAAAPHGSLWSMMRRRYDSYKRVVVRPFFREHFARLDRQIVLVDVLAALNAGPEALRDLERALGSVLACFSAGRKSILSTLLSPRIDRILFAATKADHLHRTSHDQLEAILRRLTESALRRAQFAGAEIDVVALAAVRATREAMVDYDREQLPAILGTPAAGEVLGDQAFDGNTEVAMFPGDLPDDPDLFFTKADAFRGLTATSAQQADFRFLRLRPPVLESGAGGKPSFPHIRLDRALQFLIGDRLP
jgi:predicted YcjX-like family ATPase